jgi:hypothetical protein
MDLIESYIAKIADGTSMRIEGESEHAASAGLDW